jgi:hypothetical protein
MFVEIEFPPEALAVLDRDTVEDALRAEFESSGSGEVTGAGMSLDGGGNLDIEVSRSGAGLRRVRNVLRKLQVSPAVKLRVNGAVLSVYNDDPPPRAPRKPNRWQPSIGDVIEIPLSNGQYGYCRATPQRHLYEFFETRSSRRLSLEILRKVPTFSSSTLWDLERVRWKVVGNIPFESWQPQQYRIAYTPVELIPSADGFLETGNVIPGRVLSAEELKTFEPIAIGGPVVLVAFLEGRLPAAVN